MAGDRGQTSAPAWTSTGAFALGQTKGPGAMVCARGLVCCRADYFFRSTRRSNFTVRSE